MKPIAALTVVTLALLGAIIAPVMTLPAQAQMTVYSPDGRALAITNDTDFASFGEGTLHLRRGVTDPIKRASVYLRTSGDVEIRLSSFRDIHYFRGRWSPRRNGRIEVNLSEAFRDRSASGRGDIEFRLVRDAFGGPSIALERLRLSGETREGRFTADFAASVGPFDRPGSDRAGGGRDGGWNGGWRGGFTLSTRGDGSYRDPRGRIHEVEHALVELERDGDFTLALASGYRTIRFRGSWTRGRDRDCYELELREADGMRVDGGGCLYLNRDRRLDRLDLRGRSRAGSITLDFRAARGGGW